MEQKTKNKKIWIYGLLVLIIALGLFMRVHSINQAPPGVYPDEAVNGMDAATAEMTGHYQWFYPANNGREGLFMNLIAFCFKFFGVSVLSLKLPSIIFGTLAIWGMYLLGKELFKKDSVGLIGAFLMAVSFYPLNFSRIAFRGILLPFVLVFAFYFLLRAVRTKKWLDFILAGAFFGLGIHTYIAFRIAPAILAVLLISFILSHENFLKEYWKKILVYAIATTVIVAPMLYTFYVHPDYLFARTSEISVFSPQVNHGHLATELLKTAGLSLGKYNFWGDQNWRQNYPPYPVLDFLTGIAFLFGLIYSIIQLVHFLKLRFKDKIRDPRLDVYVLLLSWFFIMLVPEFLSDEGLPHALRSIGSMPVALIFAALTFSYFYDHVAEHSYMYKKVVRSLLIIILVFIGVFNYVKYFGFWANNPKTASAFNKNLMEVSSYVKTIPAREDKFVIAESMQRIPIELFNIGLPNTHYVYPGQLDQINPQNKNNFEVILTDRDETVISALEQRFPNLKFSETRDSLGMSYYTLSPNIATAGNN